MRIFLPLFVLIHLSGRLTNAQSLSAPNDTIATQYSLPQANCASFPAAAVPRMFDEELLKNVKRFTPSKTQITKTEKALQQVDFGRINAKPQKSYYAEYITIIKQHLPKYKRQYYGYYNAEGHACLFINLFIENREEAPNRVPSWLTDFRWAYDGGTAYWSVYYDLKAQKFYQFGHNGEG
ncbi:hypothetical protein [Hymenobacter metallicola]|uniref:Uncharacterized protein n=1 Tax=Hymenobacter metallicola TaxID=2563114 RepID=A0A4Z0QKK1_9BACT|nr:hypothetical protein [Hymenobacter metallicola]TGE29252.1 hypothetical protein E5K02_07300 [Hymenobacter metallicola]